MKIFLICLCWAGLIACPAVAQRVPILLQAPFHGVYPSPASMQTLVYSWDGAILTTDAGTNPVNSIDKEAGVQFLSLDSGKTFLLPALKYDTLQGDSLGRRVHELPHGKTIYREYQDSVIQISTDHGFHWTRPEDTRGLSYHHWDVRFGSDPTGERVSVTHPDSLVLFSSSDGGSHWSTIYRDSLLYGNPSRPNSNTVDFASRWADPNHGLVYLGTNDFSNEKAYIATTFDGGKSWRVAADQNTIGVGFGNVSNLQYPFPWLMWLRSSSGIVYYSLDSGYHWHSDFTNRFVFGGTQFVLPNRWVAPAGPVYSLDSGLTWTSSMTNAKHAPTLLSFKDSLNGIASDGISITAATSDGGFTWYSRNNSDYSLGTVYSSRFQPNAYYRALTDTSGLTVFYSSDRGVTWLNDGVYPPANVFAAQGGNYFVGGREFVRSRAAGSQTSQSHTISLADSTFFTPIDQDFVWAGNANTLISSTNRGGHWSQNLATTIPGYADSLHYRFVALDRNTVYVRASDTIFVTYTGGQSWQLAERMPPNHAVNTNFWIDIANDSTLEVSRDAGAHYYEVAVPNHSANSLVALDENRWFLNGSYTIDGGSNWTGIPGWVEKDSLRIVDSSAAFGVPYPTGSGPTEYVLWRLDLPQIGTQGSVTEGASAAGFEVGLHPNPASGIVTISLTGNPTSPAQVEVYDMLGNKVASLAGVSPSSKGDMEFDTSKLAAGSYLVRVACGGELVTRKLTIIK